MRKRIGKIGAFVVMVMFIMLAMATPVAAQGHDYALDSEGGTFEEIVHAKSDGRVYVGHPDGGNQLVLRTGCDFVIVDNYVDPWHGSDFNIFMENDQAYIRVDRYQDGAGDGDLSILVGKVGIGSLNPNYKLEIEDTDLSPGEHLLVGIDESTTGGGVFIGYVADGSTVTEARVRAGASRNLALGSTNYPQALYILGSNGNVGIGKTSPDHKLDVEGSIAIRSGNKLFIENAARTSNVQLSYASSVEGLNVDGGIIVNRDLSDCEIRIQTDNTNTGKLVFWDDTSWAGIVQYDHSSDSMHFYTDQTEAMRIDSDGNIGIGTETPNARLEINGNLRFTEEDNDKVYFSEVTADNNNDVTLRLTLADDNSDAEKFEIYTDFWDGSSNDKVVHHFTAAGNVFHSGKVGIGTDSPDGKLDVQGSILQQGSGGIIGYISDGGNMAYQINKDSGNAYLSLYDASQNLDVKLDTNGDSYFMGGKFGVGTANPSGILEASHDGSSPDLFVDSNTGNIGFGTNIAACELVIYDDLFPFLNLVNDASGQALSDGFGIGLTNFNDGLISISEPGSDIWIATYNGEAMRINENGNVGIGTVRSTYNPGNPQRKLEVMDASNPQLRLSHNDLIFTDFDTNMFGNLQITPPSGGSVQTDSIWVNNARADVAVRTGALQPQIRIIDSATHADYTVANDDHTLIIIPDDDEEFHVYLPDATWDNRGQVVKIINANLDGDGRVIIHQVIGGEDHTDTLYYEEDDGTGEFILFYSITYQSCDTEIPRGWWITDSTVEYGDGTGIYDILLILLPMLLGA